MYPFLLALLMLRYCLSILWGLNHPLLSFPHRLFPSVSTGKVFVPKQKPIETRQDEVTTLDPELEEALSSATDTELCDLAGKKEEIPWRKQKGLKTQLCMRVSVSAVHTMTAWHAQNIQFLALIPNEKKNAPLIFLCTCSHGASCVILRICFKVRFL